MAAQSDLSRRSLLGVAGAGVAGLTLAACGAGSKAPVELSSPATGAPVPASSSAVAGGARPANAIAKLDDVPVGKSLSAQLDGKPIILARPNASTAVAFSASCTHQGCTVPGGGAILNCPCHGSAFDASTGAVLNGPAAVPLPSVAVAISNGYIVPA